jgi:hypothetical protein
MNEPSTVTRGLTLGWSIALAILTIALTTLVLLPATKSARMELRTQQDNASETESTPSTVDTAHEIDNAD